MGQRYIERLKRMLELMIWPWLTWRMPFDPVRTLAELDALDERDVIDGARSAYLGYPDPGSSRGKAFWHGWRNQMMNRGAIPIDDAARCLKSAVMAHWRAVGTIP